MGWVKNFVKGYRIKPIDDGYYIKVGWLGRRGLDHNLGYIWYFPIYIKKYCKYNTYEEAYAVLEKLRNA